MFKQFTYSAEPSIIGVNNGFTQMEFEESDLKANKAYKEIKRLSPISIFDFIKNQEDIKLSEIDTLTAVLEPKAKTTDFMVFSPYFFGCKYVVSQKVVDCFKSAGVAKGEYNLIPTNIKNIDLKYYLLSIPMIANSQIIFPNSLLYDDEESLSYEKNYLPIKSHDQYRQIIKKHPFCRFSRMSIPKKYEDQSIISVQGAIDLFFSEELIQSLKKAEVSNFIILENHIELGFSESVKV